jgi:hypothetical protein
VAYPVEVGGGRSGERLEVMMLTRRGYEARGRVGVDVIIGRGRERIMGGDEALVGQGGPLLGMRGAVVPCSLRVMTMGVRHRHVITIRREGLIAKRTRGLGRYHPASPLRCVGRVATAGLGNGDGAGRAERGGGVHPAVHGVGLVGLCC